MVIIDRWDGTKAVAFTRYEATAETPAPALGDHVALVGMNKSLRVASRMFMFEPPGEAPARLYVTVRED